MNVITFSEAAKIAGVSRQAIHALKKAHVKMKRSYPFFCINPLTRAEGINIDNPDWRLYLARNKYNPCKRTRKKPSASAAQEPGGSAVNSFIELLKIVERAVQTVMDPTRAELRKVKKLCMDMYVEGKKSE